MFAINIDLLGVFFNFFYMICMMGLHKPFSSDKMESIEEHFMLIYLA